MSDEQSSKIQQPEVSSLAGLWTDVDYFFMGRALEMARQGGQAGEVPVGAVLVSDGRIIGEGWNRPVSSSDPTSHAEMEALRQAGKVANNYRLPGSTLYVTMEPCVMCAGAIVIARVERLVFAARDIRFGAVCSQFRLADSEMLAHKVKIDEGLLAVDAAQLLTGFFQSRR